MKFTDTITNARDILISRANKLPENLLIDAVNEEGQFTMQFLLSLTEEGLSDLRNEALKKEGKDIVLFFYTVSRKQVRRKPPEEIKNFALFDFSKVASIEFNGNTAAFQGRMDDEPIHYVSVTLITK